AHSRLGFTKAKYSAKITGGFLFLALNPLRLKTLLDQNQLHITLQRLAHQLVENHPDFANTVVIGLQPRGIWLSDRIVALLRQITGNPRIDYGRLDITFYRDDVHQSSALQVPSQTDISFSVE